MPRLHINTITLDTFNAVLSRYPSAAPPKLRDLDTLRYDTIPANFAARRGKGASLTKSEVEQLVEWKLKHGTFRPKLLALVQSNPAAAITAATQQGFTTLAEAGVPDALAAVKRVAQLKGVGPATASLLLSVMSPDAVPFFSDELFRWCVWDGEGKPRGWKRVIKYNVKEYGEVLEGVRGLSERLGNGVRAVDVERVAWVLGREGVDVDAEDGADVEGEPANESVEDESEKDDSGEREAHGATVEESVPATNQDVATESVSKKGTKRKASSAKPPQEGVRKSTRTTR